ncbi:MAG: NACHT domain-containing protein, partial [Tatlockia sp.]|nr:NACHT domain-containing protein [Tatlockia sp.]
MKLKVDLLLEVVKDRTEALIKRYQGLDLDFYVPLAGFCQDSRETFDLEKGVNKLFQNEVSKVLLLTGHSGSGKTSFGQMLIRKKWEIRGITNQHSPETEVFLWIPLLSIKKPEEELIKKHLKKNLDLTKQETALILTSGYSFICVLDGYDELHTDKNLFLTNNLSALPGKIIFTCRDEILKADYL